MTAESVPADKLIGKILADRYQILHRLGEGAMGVVYKARHVKVGRTFAVKVLHARLLQDSKVALRFDREAELAGRLRHANVVGVVDVGELDGLRYMVMDFAEGPDLAQLLVEAPMPAWRIIHLVRQMLEGLYHAHEQGLIHRDFKPENVIIEHDTHGAEMPRIVDFGIAILADGGESVDAFGRLTTNGLVLGTPHYMAPEQAVADPIDHRIDLFALGIVIYEMLCGRLPFDGSGAEVARANLLLEPPPIKQRVPYLEVDPLLEAFARRLMAKKPKARPQTANAARELLDLIERDRPAAAALLGVPLELSGRAPAETTPLVSQPRAGAYAVPGSAKTRRLRATPSPTEPVLPPALAVLPPEAVALAAAALPPPPALESPAMQLAFSAAHPLASLPIPNAPIAHETSIRTPLSWPGTPAARRRRPLIIAGVALGTLGVVAWWVATTGPSVLPGPDPVVMAPIGEAGSRGVATPTTMPAAQGAPVGSIGERPAVAGPAIPAAAVAGPAIPAAAAPVPAAASRDPVPTPARAELSPRGPNASAPRATEIRPSTKRVPVREPRAHEVRAAEVKARTAKAAASTSSEGAASDATGGEVTNTADPEPASGARGGSARPVDARPARSGGITANDLSKLWSNVGIQLVRLPRDKSQDLWSQYELLHIQTLMAAPPAQRDEAAAALQQISAEASRRSH